MWRAYKNYELGDNKDFINDLVMLHHRIKHIGDYHNQEQLIEERGTINEGVDDLWERYNEFKSARSVLDPNYQTYHNIALDSVLRGKDIASAVQALKNHNQWSILGSFKFTTASNFDLISTYTNPDLNFEHRKFSHSFRYRFW